MAFRCFKMANFIRIGRNFLKIYYFHTKILCLKLGSCIIQQEMDIVDSNVCHDKCLTRNKGKTVIVTELYYFLAYSKCPVSQCNILTNQWTTDYGLMMSRSKILNGKNPHPKIPKNQNIPLKCVKCLPCRGNG